MTDPVIGIDLGTTNSCCAVADENGEVRLIPYRGGEYTIPSIYAVDNKGNELVGYEAKRQWQLNPKNTIYGSKRMLGMNFDADMVNSVRENITYEIDQGDRNDVVVKLEDRALALPDISARILAKIRDVAAEHLGCEVKRAVVTVPAYYNDRQRQCVREAGDLIGLEIVHILNEPTAAAIAYGADRDLNETLIVYDLGGGTFDVSVIEVRNRVFDVQGTGGDVFLGGIDFDDAIISFVLGSFKTANDIDLSEDAIAMQRIRDMAEKVKVDLSSRSQVALNIPFIGMSAQGQALDVDVVVSRDELEVLVTPLIERTLEVCASVLDDVGKTPSDVDQVLLVGGQTRMPMIRDQIQAFFNREPSKSVHPDEAVAIGAARYAWSMSTQNAEKIQLLDVLPMAIGIARADKKLHKLFSRNAAVPNRKTFTFTTHVRNQKTLDMPIYQGDNERADDNELLGRFTFDGLRPGEAGSVRVEVTFDVSPEGILSLSAKDLDTGGAMSQAVDLSGGKD